MAQGQKATPKGKTRIVKDTHIYLDIDTYKRLEKAAARENRPSITNMVLAMVLESLDRRKI